MFPFNYKAAGGTTENRNNGHCTNQTYRDDKTIIRIFALLGTPSFRSEIVRFSTRKLAIRDRKASDQLASRDGKSSPPSSISGVVVREGSCEEHRGWDGIHAR